MIRSLWTAASGMKAQQTNVDTISNNLANVNTTGYKKETAEFKSLLYQNLQTKSTTADGSPKPIAAQVGLGVRNSAILSRFDQGSLTHTENTFDLAVEGDGFFEIALPGGQTGYTRNGAFTAALTGNGYSITTTEGYALLDTNGNPINLPQNYIMTNVTIDSAGQICYPDENNNNIPIGVTISLAQFTNPAGLEKSSGSTFLATESSGEPIQETTLGKERKSVMKQGYLEASNVQAVDEMVNLIVAQRAYELNSKIINASDEMMQQANNLR